MKNYELMYVVDPALEDGGDAIKQKIESLITENEGSIVSFEKLGKKRLAYEIAKRQYGIYCLSDFRGEGKIIKAIEGYIRLTPAILRYIILAFSDRELQLREDTDRIQREEDERMRLGGKPMHLVEEEVKESLSEENKTDSDAGKSAKTDESAKADKSEKGKSEKDEENAAGGAEKKAETKPGDELDAKSKESSESELKTEEKAEEKPEPESADQQQKEDTPADSEPKEEKSETDKSSESTETTGDEKLRDDSQSDDGVKTTD